jgi:carboxymethylenebutenolidase
VVVVHEASGLNDNIRDICGRFAAEGYAALGADLFEGRNRAVCMARMFVGGMAGNLDYCGVPALKDALGHLASPEVDAARIGAIGFCLGGSIVLTWACTDNRLAAIAPFYGAAPKPGRRSAGCARWWGRGRARISPPRRPGCWRQS